MEYGTLWLLTYAVCKREKCYSSWGAGHETRQLKTGAGAQTGVEAVAGSGKGGGGRQEEKGGAQVAFGGKYPKREICHRIHPVPDCHKGQKLASLKQFGYLMKKVLDDATNGISLLAGPDYVDSKKIGTLGHSYGGNTALFLSALDVRISFSCASGSACTYKNRMRNGVGIEMASVIPGFIQKYDIDDLVACIAPRSLLIVSSDDDKYSKDAPDIVENEPCIL